MSWRTEGALPCMFKQICSEDKGRLKAESQEPLCAEVEPQGLRWEL